ncbi:MAG: radical SAM protein [Elusimicrobiales bacterium]|nr:radical SAM protein [Elusimicrobiales bacterium]
MKVLRNLNILIRPVNDTCNLSCEYCITKNRYSGDALRRETLKPETFQKLIAGIKGSQLQTVRFTWHGGEPLLMPDSFYREIFTLQRGLGGIDQTTTLQTNGTLVNEERLRFFKEQGVCVGFSLDGCKYSHNAYRFSDPKQFETVIGNIRLAKKLGVRFSIIMVAHEKNVRDVKEICDFLDEMDPPNGFTINPLFLGQGEMARLSLPQEEFSKFLYALYENRKNTGSFPGGYIYAAQKGLSKAVPKLCFFSGRCANFVSMNGSGDMFSTCYENSAYYLGNINATPLPELLEKHLKQHETKIDPQFQNQTLYREMGSDPELVYFQGKGCTKRLVDGRDPYFRSYIDLIEHVKKDGKKTNP